MPLEVDLLKKNKEMTIMPAGISDSAYIPRLQQE